MSIQEIKDKMYINLTKRNAEYYNDQMHGYLRELEQALTKDSEVLDYEGFILRNWQELRQINHGTDVLKTIKQAMKES